MLNLYLKILIFVSNILILTLSVPVYLRMLTIREGALNPPPPTISKNNASIITIACM